MDRMNDVDRNEELPPALERAVRALDARAAERAARIDVERVAAKVVERLREAEVGRPPRVLWMPPAALRAAAAVIVVVAAGLVVTVADHHAPAAAGLPVAAAALDSLSAGELEAVLQAVGDVRSVADSVPASVSGQSLEGLSEDQLETLLASLDGAES